jgi:CRP-like cAMP-binding protein
MSPQDDTRKALIPERRSFSAHSTIFKEGDPADCAYIVESGEVEITKTVNGRRITLGTLHGWEMFGELALIDDQPRMATATAIDDSVCMVVSKTSVAQMMDDAPQGLNTVIHSLAQIVRKAGQDLAEARYQLLEQENPG